MNSKHFQLWIRAKGTRNFIKTNHIFISSALHVSMIISDDYDVEFQIYRRNQHHKYVVVPSCYWNDLLQKEKLDSTIRDYFNELGETVGENLNRSPEDLEFKRRLIMNKRV